MIPDTLKARIQHELRMSDGEILEGWMVPERGVELAEIIIDNKPQVVVEIGVFGGRSLIAQGLALKENGQGKIYGIDPWRKDDAIEAEQDPANRTWWAGCDLDDIHRKAMYALWRNGLEDIAVIIRAPSQHCVELFPQIDVLLIDGNHSEVASCRDVLNYGPRVRSGGFIWFDDANWLSTQAALVALNPMCELVRDASSYRLYRKK